MSVQKCSVCYRSAVNEHGTFRYCMYHSQAYERLLTHHKSWICAYGELPWQEYLQLVAKKNETGEWIKEVIQAELKEKLGK